MSFSDRAVQQHTRRSRPRTETARSPSMERNRADMKDARTLVLGAGTPDMKPETHIPAGPWCLAGLPELMPLFEAFYRSSDPLSGVEAQETAAAQARRLVARLAERIGARCNRERGSELPPAFWDAALAPWLCTAVEVLVERAWRLEALLCRYGTQPLRVPLITADNSVPFADSRDFMRRGVLQPAWNHRLFSRLLERRLPSAWQAEQLVSEPEPTFCKTSGGLKSRLLQAARRMAFSLPFPPIKGFSAGQSLLFSLSLLLNTNREDRTVPLAAWRSEDCPPLPLNLTEEEAETLVLSMLPLSVSKARLPHRAPRALCKTRVASVAACDDDAYRLRLALARAGGCRLAFIQHGGDYGYVRSSVAFPLAEYSQQSFFSWGWKRHGNLPGNIVPLPHSQLVRLRDRHRETAPVLLFVGTEMALLPYTLKSMTRPEAMFDYREDKARFLAALPALVREHTLYRPYFAVPCSLEDGPWVARRFPEVKLCTGALEEHLLHCRLLVLDHLGTTLAQALSAGVPVVLFWRPHSRYYTPEAEALLGQLREAGVVRETPEAAAAQVAAIWEDPAAWRDSDPVRKACSAWSRLYSFAGEGNENALWRKALRRM